MTTQKLAVATALALLISVAFAASVSAAPPTPGQGQPILEGDVIDIGPELRAKDLPIKGLPDVSKVQLERSLEIQATQAYTVGDELEWLALDDYMGYYFFTTYTVVTITDHAEVWVQNDLGYYNPDGTPDPLHPDASDPKYVTAGRMNYLAETFDDIIYPTDTDFFGANDDMDGSGGWESVLGIQELDADDGTRVIILVSNVRDENFYDPVASPSYIAGFYSPTYELYSGRNMITIDSKQWHRRVGGGVDRPYLYDSTLAHEFQHLIHDDYSPNEDSWVNEGMSGMAEFLNGYWFTEDLGDRTQWQLWPENSVVLWGDQNSDLPGEILADYQLVNAFMLYTTGRIDGVYTDTAKLTQEPTDGILGFNTWLSDTVGSSLTFEEIFDDFRADMLHGGYTDDPQPAADWNADFLSGYQSPLEQRDGVATSRAYLGELRDNLDREGYDTPGVPPFGTDFLEVCWSSDVGTVEFDGDEAPAGTAWSAVAASDIYTPSGSVDGDVLYSGHTDLTDNFVVFGPVTPTVSDQLTFDHFYNIEDEWDYGFVQVTTDTTGATGWTSLDITGTMAITDPHAHPVIKENVPGFTGFSAGWVPATYDIGAEYGGEQVLLAFRYSTDWASAGSSGDFPSGWAVDNVMVGSTTLTTGTVGTGRSIQEVRGLGNRFSLEFLTWEDGDAVTVNNVYTASLSPAMTGTLDLAALGDAGFDEAGERGVLMVSLKLDTVEDLIAGGMVARYADYDLTGLPPSICTSDVDAYGDTHAGRDYVYAGEPITAAVHADNLGSSPNVTTTEPLTFYIGVVQPANATFDSATASAVYTDDLSTVADTFPTAPGVYWTGPVTRVKDFDAVFETDPGLSDGELVTVTVHYASDASAAPEQSFIDEDSVEVLEAFGLSAEAAVKDTYSAGDVAQFVASLLNLSSTARDVELTMNIPPSTTLASVGAADISATSAGSVVIETTVPPYATAGAQEYVLSLNLDPDLEPGDTVTSTMQLEDLETGDTVDMESTISIAYDVYMPLIVKSSS